MRKLLIAALLFFLTPALWAQSTSLTMNVTDSGSVVWANGTYTLSFVGQPNSKWSGGTLATSFTGSLNSSGSVTVSIPDNNTITPSPSSWKVYVCPNPAVTAGPSGCYTIASQTVTGSAQTLNVTPPAIVITVPTTATVINPIVAYADAEISGGWVGFSYYNVTSGLTRQCTAVSAGSCSSWQAGGGTAPVSSLPATCTPGTSQPVLLTVTPYLVYTCTATNTWSPAQSMTTGQFNVKNYGAVGDAQNIHDGVLNSTTLLTSATANWACPGSSYPCSTAGVVGSDVGKLIVCSNPASSTVPIPAADTILSIQSATNITLSSAATATASSVNCSWGTQDDTAAILAATAAAIGNINSRTGVGGPILGPYYGTVYFPPGGYIVSNRLLYQVFNNNQICPSFQGAAYFGKSEIYLSPRMTINADGRGALMEFSGCSGFFIRDLAIDGLNYQNVNFQGGQSLIRFATTSQWDIKNFSIQNFSTNSTGDLINFNSAVQGNIDQLYVQNGIGGQANNGVGFVSSAGILVKDFVFSNNSSNNLHINNNAPDRTPTTQQLTFEQGFVDECGASNGTCTVFAAGQANFVGVSFFGAGTGGGPVMSVDGTSMVYLTDVNCGAYNSANNFACMSIASGGQVFSTMSTLRGNGTGAVVTGPAGANFYDVGGNIFQNWTSTTCNNSSPADPSGCSGKPAMTLAQGYSGGIIPHASVTHTPNTCYAATGTLVASQNLCNALLDQNYQVLNIAAQSGGASPSASSCTTAPVVTLSDGTHTGTLTLTTGKTAWVSTVDSSSVGAMFTSGSTLTISVGTFTCATPPTNLSVTYALQSVLNP
jgi:hypothetical protein